MDPDGEQITVLNSRLNYEQNLKSAIHEQKHIDDLGNQCQVGLLESLRHNLRKD